MNWSLKQIFTAMGSLVALLAIIAIGSIIMSRHYSGILNDAATNRYKMYQLADEMRQSSDDLTRLARTYVVSAGEIKWEKQYLEILDIRNGKIPRPKGYEQIYWDFRAADIDPSKGSGETVALIDLMKKYGISEAELAKLSEAQDNSNELVQTETIAMNMVKGLYADSNGGFTVKGEPDLAKARDMMHNLAYHQYKAKIMKPVNEFFLLLDQRTQNELISAQTLSTRWEYVAIATTIIMSIMVLIALLVVRNRTSALLKQVNNIAEGFAEGNLHQKISASDHSEEGRLLSIMDTMQEKLASVVNTIRINAEGVATASSEIASGNSDLSNRTEEQASSLEETASSMEELTSTVKQNADNARQANQLAEGASTVAIKGGEVVSQVVNTMKSINESSHKIVDIISVIDGIAFQTNILALNAAVEAARAGEQGRGFAVVATEVRTLAQRSAAAAKEIKELINDSVSKVSEGTRLVDEAGTTMGEIVNSVKRVTDIMNEISVASNEQSTGIEQVNQSVTQMDESTQQNAALVEEAAAAAIAMQDQAKALIQAVSTFKLSDDHASITAVRKSNRSSPAATVTKMQSHMSTRKVAVNSDKSTTTTRKAAGSEEDWEEF
ncbi:methyl-accepting chemotaxis protein [Nitrosomonas sp. PY1]|uniref:methyl-accepting chemotaxis protein n=1 Tax=Nitrosomonas sp. PY1 TaxID=1803906 RepID=UPI00207F682C|nr:methyl-accepting chemotaxis protein [Nitrosomonas sp. PY1]GKS68287.1 methyl-accepting chemotaxis protein [Nitrosomonas sp. PY1]